MYRLLHANAMILNFVFLGATFTMIRRENESSEARLQDVVRTLENEVTVRERAETDVSAALSAHQRFLAMISHELRTPMNGVLGMVHLIDETELDATQRSYVEVINESGQLMVNLVDDLLDMSKLQAGAMLFDPQPTAVAELLERAIAPMRLQVERSEVRVQFDVAPELPGWLSVDAQRLRQIVTNLVGNAVKFTAEGTITVRTRLLQAAAGNTLEVEIEDTGIGISAAALPNIFDAFIQAETSTSRRFGGTGLGLSISRQLAQLMGGALTVRSTVNVGTTFVLRLPTRVASAPRHEWTDESDGTGDDVNETPHESRLSVVIADDNAVNQTVLRLMLEGWGHDVRVAASGAEALAMVAERCPDVVLMDLQMPEMDGLETTRRIHALAGPAARLRVVACTASALPEDRRRCLGAGMHDVVPKPVRPAALRDALRG